MISFESVLFGSYKGTAINLDYYWVLLLFSGLKWSPIILLSEISGGSGIVVAALVKFGSLFVYYVIGWVWRTASETSTELNCSNYST